MILLNAFFALLLFLLCALCFRRLFCKNTVGAPALKLVESDMFLFGFITVFMIFAGLGASNYFSDTVLDAPKEWTVFLPTIFLQIFTIVGVWAFFKFSSGGIFDVFKKKSFADVLCGVKFFIAALCLTPLAMAFSYFTIEFFTGAAPERQEIVDIFAATSDPLALGLAIISIVFLAPIAEELFFRALLFRIFRDGLFDGFFCGIKLGSRGRTFWAAVAASAVFAYIHFSFYAFVPLLVTGLILTSAYSKRGALITPIITHSLFNASNILIILIFANESV